MADKLPDGFKELESEPYALLMSNLFQLGRKVRQGRYNVHLGFVDWTLYPFENGTMAMSINTADERPFAREHLLTVLVEMFTRFPATRKDGVQGADFLTSAAMKADIWWMFARLREARVPDPESEDLTLPVVLRVVAESARIVDVSDSEAKLQGVMFNVEVQI